MPYERTGTPLAYFLTWTTYGTWLHGDGRGSVARLGPGGTPRLVAPNPAWRARERRNMSSEPLILAPEMRSVVEQTIDQHCRHRGWRLYSRNIRTQHVHVVAAVDIDPEVAMNQFKSWATRRLREAGLAETDAKVWTRHGSTRWLWDADSLNRAVQYVRDMQ